MPSPQVAFTVTFLRSAMLKYGGVSVCEDTKDTIEDAARRMAAAQAITLPGEVFAIFLYFTICNINSFIVYMS